jgi:CDP-paratose 2-epimerase
MSCIYGPHQHGNEDQGWVAHFAIRALERRPITLYGDGAQVRDLLFVDDLVEAMLAARDLRASTAGRAFNVGGGPANAVSLLETLDLIGELVDVRPRLVHEGPRAGDQRYYVADTRRLGAMLGWEPQVNVQEGVEQLVRWLADSRPARSGLRAVAG